MSFEHQKQKLHSPALDLNGSRNLNYRYLTTQAHTILDDDDIIGLFFLSFCKLTLYIQLKDQVSTNSLEPYVKIPLFKPITLSKMNLTAADMRKEGSLLILVVK